MNVVTNKKYKVTNDFESKLPEIIKKHKENSLFDIDGIIIHNHVDNEVNSSGNPSYAFAFKQISNVKLLKLLLKKEWNPSKDGYSFVFQ